MFRLHQPTIQMALTFSADRPRTIQGLQTRLRKEDLAAEPVTQQLIQERPDQRLQVQVRLECTHGETGQRNHHETTLGAEFLAICWLDPSARSAHRSKLPRPAVDCDAALIPAHGIPALHATQAFFDRLKTGSSGDYSR
jgi:hypothetical protein